MIFHTDVEFQQKWSTRRPADSGMFSVSQITEETLKCRNSNYKLSKIASKIELLSGFPQENINLGNKSYFLRKNTVLNGFDKK